MKIVNFDRKYTMTKEDNIFHVKRMIVDIIWKEAQLEGINVTYPATQEIYDGKTVAGLTIEQTKAINNLKYAWAFVLENLDVNVDIKLVRQINGLVGAENVVKRAGELRFDEVNIGGTSWKPTVPDYDTVKECLSRLSTISSPIERALETFAHIVRGQWFNDGNKRTAQLVANLILVSNSCGVLAVDIQDKDSFNKELVAFYESNNIDKFKNYLYNTTISGQNCVPKDEAEGSINL